MNDCFVFSPLQNGRTLLHYGCETKDVELCQLLLDGKVNVNNQDEVQNPLVGTFYSFNRCIRGF